MPEPKKQIVVEDLSTFVKKQPLSGLVACGRHDRLVSMGAEESVLQLELPRGLVFGPFCWRRYVAVIYDIGEEIFVCDDSYLPQIEELAAEYEKYSGRQVRITIFERRSS